MDMELYKRVSKFKMTVSEGPARECQNLPKFGPDNFLEITYGA